MLFLVMYTYWLCIVTDGYGCSLNVLYSYGRLLTVMHCYGLLLTVIHGYEWL